jgi:hypothetical protein
VGHRQRKLTVVWPSIDGWLHRTCGSYHIGLGEKRAQAPSPLCDDCRVTGGVSWRWVARSRTDASEPAIAKTRE